MADFNAQITFSAEVGEVLQQLSELTKATTDFGGATGQAQAQLQSAMGQTEGNIKGLQTRLVELYAQRAKGDQTEALQAEIKLTEQALQGLQGEMRKFQAVLPEMGKGTAQAGVEGASGIMEMVKSFGLAELAVHAFEAGLNMVRSGVQRFLGMGFEFDRTIETANIGIGALIATQNNLTDANGRTLDGQERLTAGMVLGEEQVQKLRLASFSTVATFEQLTHAYQQGLGPMQQAGVELDQTVQLTQRFAQAAGALGLDINTLGHELRATFGGQISARITRIASALHIRNEDIQAWRQAGTLVDEMNKRLEFFGMTGDRVEASWQGVESNVLHFFQAFSGESVKPLFEGLKTGIHDALHDAFDLTTGDFSASFQGLLKTGKDVFGEIGVAAKDSLNWAVGAAMNLSGWFKENREDVLHLTQDVRIVATQIAGILKDVISIGGETAGLASPLGVLQAILEGIGLGVAVVRDVLTVVESGLVSVGTILVQMVLSPIQLVLLGIGEAMNFLKKGSGDAVAKVAEDMQVFVDKGNEYASSLVKPFAEGKSAVAQYGDALLDAAKKREKLEEKDAKPVASGGKPKASVIKSPDDNTAVENTQDEVSLHIKELLAATSQKVTLAEKEEAETQAFLNRVRAEEIQINKDASKKKGALSEAQAAEDRKALEEVKQKGLANIRQKYAAQQVQDLAKLNNQLLVEEGRGYEAQVAQIHAKFDKMRQEARNAGADQAAQDRINADESAAVSNAQEQRIEADIKKLRAALKELETEKGRALSFAEETAEVQRFGQVMGLTKASIAQVTTELNRQKDAGAGWMAGIADFTSKAGNLFQTFKTAALTVFQGIEGSFQRVLHGITSGTMQAAQVLKTLWKGVSDAVIQALAKMAAEQMVNWGVEKGMALWRSMDASKRVAENTAIGMSETGKSAEAIAAATAQEAANAGVSASETATVGPKLTSATSGFFAAFSGIPFVGLGLALAAIAAMMVVMHSITAHANGGVIDRPMLALMGETGETEIVANETSFKEWGNNTLQMGASIARANDAAQRTVSTYSQMGSSYANLAASASKNAARNGKPGSGGVVVQVQGHVIGESVDSANVMGRLTKKSIDQYNRRRN